MKNKDLFHGNETLSSLEGIYMMSCRAHNGRTLDYADWTELEECVSNIRAFIRYLTYMQANDSEYIQLILKKYSLLPMLETVVKMHKNNEFTTLQTFIINTISDVIPAIESLSVLRTSTIKETSNEK